MGVHVLGGLIPQFAGYAPHMIPHDLWEMFREVENLKSTIEAAKPDAISQEVRGVCSCVC